MLFKVYELRPGYTAFRGEGVISAGSQGNSYSIIVGTKSKPTNRDRERIERSVREAWESLFDPTGWDSVYDRELYIPPYGLAVVPDSSSPVGEPEPPPFAYNGFYIVFALLETDGSGVSEEEERETAAGILQALGAHCSGTGPKPRIALVTLYNCSVQVLEGPGPNREPKSPLPHGRRAPRRY